MIQVAPLTSITTMSPARRCTRPVATIVTPSTATAIEATASVDHRARAGCITSAPPTAPAPKHPSRIPYPIALLLTLCATVGSSANDALAKNITTPDRSMSPRIAGA